jgi:hypothetical protein
MAGRIVQFLFGLTLLLTTCQAAIIEKYFNMTWVMANPDGMQERKVIGVNNTWPLPVLEVSKGDRLIVHVYNGLGEYPLARLVPKYYERDGWTIYANSMPYRSRRIFHLRLHGGPERNLLVPLPY